MKKRVLIYAGISAALLLAFAVLTILLCTFDVQVVGPQDASVGLATLNSTVWEAIGQSEIAGKLSTLGGLLMLAAVAAFGVLGLVQLITRKNLLRVDKELYVMAGGLVLLAGAYLLFELWVINFRPVLDEGALAPSYPSSHTMLAIAVAGMGMAYLQRRVKRAVVRCVLISVLNLASVATVVCRVLYGVHWPTDIVGGVLLGLTITYVYLTVCAALDKGESA
jgi:undecaprenyl-diphosphatase